MELPTVNLLAVLIAAIASMAVGFAWYSPILFGNPWMKLMGMKKGGKGMGQEMMMKTYGLSTVAALITAYVLAMLLSAMGAASMNAAFMLGFWLWLGFIAPVMFTSVIFEGKTFMLYLINAGYQLVSVMAMAGVLVWMM